MSQLEARLKDVLTSDSLSLSVSGHQNEGGVADRSFQDQDLQQEGACQRNRDLWFQDGKWEKEDAWAELAQTDGPRPRFVFPFFLRGGRLSMASFCRTKLKTQKERPASFLSCFFLLLSFFHFIVLDLLLVFARF